MSIVIAYLPSLLHGLVVTLSVAALSYVLGMLLSLLWLPCLVKNNICSVVMKLWIQLLRNLPELIVLFAMYFFGLYVGKTIFHATTGVGFISAVCALAFIFSAYGTKALQSAYLAVKAGQKDAAVALGMNKKQAWLSVVLPQMLKHALPVLGNLWLIILKDASLVSLVGVSDLLFSAQAAANATFKPFTFYALVMVMYLCITFISNIAIKYMNKQWGWQAC